MRVLRASNDRDWLGDATNLAAGAMVGLAIGMLISRAPRPRGFGEEFRDRARDVARRLRPARLRRLITEQAELDRLEDAVLDAFVAHDVFRDRAVDIGAISPGIIELSGSVQTEGEADGAVSLAEGVPGVRTVINRLEIDSSFQRPPLRRRLDPDDLEASFTHQEARVGGMGRRRQGASTDPGRPDDSQKMREEALAAADRDQFADEGFTRPGGRTGARPEVEPPARTNFDEDELDNQDPHGKHAKRTLDAPPQELRTESRVGEGEKPGTELRLEQSDVDFEESSRRETGE